MTEVPDRRCVGCGRTKPKDCLERFTVIRGELAYDPQQRMPGRGAYICHDVRCVAAAVKRRSLGRALRGKIAVDHERILSMLNL